MEIRWAARVTDAKIALLQGSRRAHRAMRKDTILTVKDGADGTILLMSFAIFADKEVFQRDGPQRGLPDAQAGQGVLEA